ncbi:MAG: fibronectin type III domain-containing protein [Bacillota bacterium]
MIPGGKNGGKTVSKTIKKPSGKTGRRAASILLTAVLLLLQGLIMPVSAADLVPQPAPEKLRVEAIHDTPPQVEPPIGYNEFDKYYVDLKCDRLALPQGVPSPSIYLNYYLQEVNKPYRPSRPLILKEGNVPAKTGEDNEIRLRNLESGTVYYAYARAYYKYTQDSITYTSSESNPSNTVRFLTDIEINAYPYGTNQIKIEWDDVWYSGKRMDYKLYISENEAFANSPPIYIGEEQIGRDGPVKVNEAAGKLEYIHTVRDPGRVYHIKIVPDTPDTELKRSPESRVVVVSSYILAKTTKMSVTDEGTVWKLEWSPVVTGIGGNVKVSYQIYRGSGEGGSLEEYMATVSDTVFFLVLKPGEEHYYYVVKAIVTRDGVELYPGIKIQSQRIYIRESEVPSTPAVPELVPEFSNAGVPIISYDEELRPDRAVILWKAPLKGDGNVDEEIVYDMWLISDPNTLDNPPAGTMIASDIKMGEGNKVMSGTKHLGYKYYLNDLVPNSTYYLKIVAKKSYIEFVDGELRYITLQSDAAMKIIITPTLGPVDQPVVPGRPPLELKKDSQGKEMVTNTSAVITLKNKWYEQHMPPLSGGKANWVYRTPEQINEAGLNLAPPVDNLVDAIENGTADPLQFRKVEYDEGVTLDVGIAIYTLGFDYSSLENLPTDKVVNFPAIPNDPDEDVHAPGAIPDGEKHNINITVDGLEPNTTYVIWVRAARRDVGLISGPSDPIIVTTLPELPDTVEKPTVPVFNYSHAGDVYIDLGWNFNTRYVYYLEYGTVDDRSKATGRAVITPKDLEFTTYYRVTGLVPDTVYYFWIRAEVTSESGEIESSDFSDSFLVKTTKDIPPDTPKGFGIKKTQGDAAKNSVTFEWIAEEGMDYILEIDDSVDYHESARYEIKGASEFTVGNLRSNFRYYARLYAYDPVKKLASVPTQSIVVRTPRSDDDYDSDEDTEDIISGDFIQKDPVSVDGVWTIRIVGVNADRFVQHVRTDNVLDYVIDLRTMPGNTKKISVVISGRVFKALSTLGENLIIRMSGNMIVIRPGVMPDAGGIYRSAAVEADYIFGIVPDSSAEDSNTRNLTFRTPVSKLEISLSDGIVNTVEKLERPLKVIYEYTYAAWYKPGTTFGHVLPDGSTEWIKAASSGSFDPDRGLGTLAFETLVPGRLAVADLGKDFFDDISGSYARNSIANVASVHKLKSITGRKFEPAKNLTIGDCAKFMLDMLDVDYGSNYMTLAVKAGIVPVADSGSAAQGCTREKLIAMAMRVCELKTSQCAKASSDETYIYKDIRQADPKLLPKIRFALEIGVITSRFSDTLGPKDVVTRAEAMVLLEKLLRYTGEL